MPFSSRSFRRPKTIACLQYSSTSQLTPNFYIISYVELAETKENIQWMNKFLFSTYFDRFKRFLFGRDRPHGKELSIFELHLCCDYKEIAAIFGGNVKICLSCEHNVETNEIGSAKTLEYYPYAATTQYGPDRVVFDITHCCSAIAMSLREQIIHDSIQRDTNEFRTCLMHHPLYQTFLQHGEIPQADEGYLTSVINICKTYGSDIQTSRIDTLFHTLRDTPQAGLPKRFPTLNAIQQLLYSLGINFDVLTEKTPTKKILQPCYSASQVHQVWPQINRMTSNQGTSTEDCVQKLAMRQWIMAMKSPDPAPFQYDNAMNWCRIAFDGW